MTHRFATPVLATLLMALALGMVVLCSRGDNGKHLPDHDIVILYDNDVHGAFYGYSKIAALKRESLTETPYVMLASMGDYSQGGPLCSVSRGKYAVSVMNECGYDLVTLGNHEFDYDIPFLHYLKDSLRSEIILDNFADLRTGENFFPRTAIREYGQTRIGFIGAVTPITQIIDCPQAYVDDEGNDIYTFHRNDFFERIQDDIDHLTDQGADFIILFSHLGDNPFDPITSESTIANTRGLDAVIDGHAHHIIEGRWLKDIDGKKVLLASTGCDFQNIGRFTISRNGDFKSELLPTHEVSLSTPVIDQMVDVFDRSIDNLPPFAHTSFPLISYAVRYDTYERNCITNLGQLVADAYKHMTHADIGWINSGSLRVGIPEGDITYRALLATFPHQNNICVYRFKGSRIIDALEFGLQRWPADFGAYPILSGLTFTIDPSKHPEIVRDSIGQFIRILPGERRVNDVRILNPKTGQYEPIDPDREYSIASNEYNLRHSGDSGILAGGVMEQQAEMKDVQVVESYIRTVLHGIIPDQYNFVRKELEVSYK